MIGDDFQHLLKERHRDDLIVIPRQIITLFAASLALFCLGLGFAIGSFLANPSWGTWTLGVCVALALYLGRRINRLEAASLGKYRKG
ncbi:MAG: hypothetical protein ACSHYF_00140 [Verrucomicrobiaceae bacterium]